MVNWDHKNKKWVAGAAAMAAGVTAAQAATVQISLVGNSIGAPSNTSSFNRLFADLTGDGIDDIILAIGGNGLSNPTAKFRSFAMTIGENPRIRVGYSTGVAQSTSGNFLSVNGNFQFSNSLESTDLYAVSFSDAKINGGAQTSGFVEVHAFVRSRGDMAISLTRLVFDDAGTAAPGDALAGGSNTEFSIAVPEPSSLSLLALGAAGILTHRRRRKTA